MNARGDTVVVGAGIVGCAIAFRLAHAGRRVQLVDRQGPGQGCSRGNAGVLATQAVEPLSSPATLRQSLRYLFGNDSPLIVRPRYLARALPWLLRFALAARNVERGTAQLAALQAHSLDAFSTLLADAGLADLLKTRGHLLVTENAAARPQLEASSNRLARFGISSRWLDRHAIRQLAPGLSESVAGGLYFADTAHVVDPLRVCRGLADAVSRAGGRVERAEVSRIRPQAGGGFELDAGDRRFRCESLVIAAGAHSAPLARQLGERVPLETERGYHLTLPGARPDFRLPVSSLERHTYMTPMSGGLRVTGFVELGGTALPPDPRRFDDLRRHVGALLPGVDVSGAGEWMGFRPSLPDHLPVIACASAHPRAVLAFGHQHLGLTLSGITADIVATLLDGGSPPVDISGCSAARFR